MEILAGAAIGACIGMLGCFAYNMAKDKGAKPERKEFVYLLRVDPSGKVEIKTAPIQLWTWKY